MAGIAESAGMSEFSTAAVSCIVAPRVSRHRATIFLMSGRNPARFRAIYLNGGVLDGRRLLPRSWIDRNAAEAVETGLRGMRAGHGYRWWVPSPDTGLPAGSYRAFGFGYQALIVAPVWRIVVVHQADLMALFRRFLGPIGDRGMAPDTALEKRTLDRLGDAGPTSRFCRDDRFVLRREFRGRVDRRGAPLSGSGHHGCRDDRQQQRPAEIASSCSSVRLRSGGSARCTVYVSLSWTTMFMESGIVMSNFPLVVAFGSASSCCLNSVSSADSSTVCYSFSQPLLTAIPLTLRVLRDRVRVGADRRRLGAEPGGGGHGAVQRRLLRCRGRRGRWGVRDRGRPRAGSRAHDQRIRRRTKDRVIAGM